MTDLNQPTDILMPPTEKTKLPGSINVLTILTFIGCGLGLISSVYNFFNAKSGLDKMEAAINSPEYENMPALAKKFLSPEALEMARKSYENRVPINLIALIGIVLCIYGAMQMRKLKAQGYTVYVIGELLPLVSFVVFLGAASLTGFAGIMTICFLLLFVILYTTQRKYLINK